MEKINQNIDQNLIVHKINESYSYIDGPIDKLNQIYEFLKVERPGAYFEPLVKAGYKSPFDFYSEFHNKKLMIMNGHIEMLKGFNLTLDDSFNNNNIPWNENDINLFYNDIKKVLPFEPYDFQVKAFKESLMKNKHISKMCTSSGKSLTISLILEFMRRHNKKGLLLVPNINLLTQFKNDIKEYNLNELYEDIHIIGGGSTERHFNNSLTISTWQSLQDRENVDLSVIDYVICDELHRFSSTVTSSIVKDTVNCKFKFGFTGTLPDSQIQKMQLLGLFGMPKTYITSRELIERGLGTPIVINAITFDYNIEDKKLFNDIKIPFRAKSKYPNQLKFIKEHTKRNEFITNLSCKLKTQGNSLVLFQHTEHGKELFTSIMKKLYPDVIVENKNITGKNSFEFQEQYGVYFLNGEDNAKTREATRKILEDDLYCITLENDSKIKLHGNKEVILKNGNKKLVKDLTNDDLICDNWLTKNYKKIL